MVGQCWTHTFGGRGEAALGIPSGEWRNLIRLFVQADFSGDGGRKRGRDNVAADAVCGALTIGWLSGSLPIGRAIRTSQKGGFLYV